MRRSVARWAAGWPVGVAVVTVVACSSSRSTSSEPPTNEAADYLNLICLNQVSLDGTQSGVTVAYPVAAMNMKLRHYPDLAAIAGFHRVESCGQAQDFVALLRSYTSAYPGFDKDEPDDLPNFAAPALPSQLPPASVTTEKLLNGTPGGMPPVILLHIFPLDLNQNPISGQGKICTGFYINKNHILTAAHCLTADFTTAYLQVATADSTGQPNSTLTTFPVVVQYRDPAYAGGDHDVGLIFVPTEYNSALPPTPDIPLDQNGNPFLDASGNPIPGPFMRLAFYAPFATNAKLWGFGLPNNDLESLDMSHVAPFATTDTQVAWSFPTTDPISGESYAGPFVCHGDSGSPVVDSLDGSPEGLPGLMPVAVTVLSFITNPDPNNPDCATNGSLVGVERIDNELLPFIQKRVQLNYTKAFVCDRMQSGTQFYARCFKQKCRVDDDCPDGSSCQGSGVNLSGCTVCKNPGSNKINVGDCSCVFGQCVPTAAASADASVQDATTE